MRRSSSLAACGAALILASSGLAAGPSEADPGPFVRALWFVQRYGNPEATSPRNDQGVKATLFKGLKDSVLTAKELEGLMDPATFKTLAGDDARLDDAEIGEALAAAVPTSRARLLPEVRAYADLLTTSLDMIDEKHRESAAEFADWLAANYQPGKPLDVTVICTANSRRSFLAATTGNIAAAYCGMPEVRFHCGGTTISACNKRTIAALKEIGVEVEPTGKEAPRGEPNTANPCYRLVWGTAARSAE
jgi:arsenate reductase